MPQPQQRREGNIRYASTDHIGYPEDVWGTVDQVIDLVQAAESVVPVTTYGPPVVLFPLPADDRDPSQWSCQVGTAITGLPRARSPLLVDDYRRLRSVVLPHLGPVRELHLTWQRLMDYVSKEPLRPRPYWRLALTRHRLDDGTLLPVPEVALFVDAAHP